MRMLKLAEMNTELTELRAEKMTEQLKFEFMNAEKPELKLCRECLQKIDPTGHFFNHKYSKKNKRPSKKPA